MKAITCLIGLFLLFLASSAKAQSDGDEIPWSINSGTMVGIGSYNLMDTYLSPSMEDKKYTGPGLRVMNERMKRVRLANYRVSRQQIISVDLASTDNAAVMLDFLAKVVKGDRYGFRGLYRLYVGLLLSFAHAIAGSKASGGWCRAWHGWFYIQYP